MHDARRQTATRAALVASHDGLFGLASVTAARVLPGREWLDEQYDTVAFADDAASRVEDWRRRSAVARAELSVARDLPYGSGAGETLDVFLPNASGAPVFVFFHGGFWRSQDKSTFSYLARRFVDEGVAVVLPNYDLCPAVGIDELLEQCRNALAWVHKNARIFCGDPQRVVVAGHSAGAHIAVSSLVTDWRDFGVCTDFITAAVGISGLYDLEPIRQASLNNDLRLDQEAALRNSPFLHAPRRRCPILLSVGGKESEEFLRQTGAYHEALVTKGYSSEALTLEDADHFSALDRSLDSEGPFLSRVLDVMST